MAKLNQLIAILNQRKAKVAKEVTEVYHLLQKSDLVKGIARDYQPTDEEGEKLAPERKSVQMTTQTALTSSRKSWELLLDSVATQDSANCDAKADVIVRGTVLLPAVPVTHLLFLEKQLTDVRTLLGSIPTLPTEKLWKWSDNHGCYVTDEELTSKTKKIEKPVVLYEATKEHPAQVKISTEDIIVGWWHTVHMSGAMPAQKKAELLDRVDQVLEAVKQARERANEMAVVEVKEGKPLFDFILNSILPDASAAATNG